jgi:hypothetical protein
MSKEPLNAKKQKKLTEEQALFLDFLLRWAIPTITLFAPFFKLWAIPLGCISGWTLFMLVSLIQDAKKEDRVGFALALSPFCGWGILGVVVIFPFFGYWAIPVGFLFGLGIGAVVTAVMGQGGTLHEISISSTIGLALALLLIPNLLMVKHRVDKQRTKIISYEKLKAIDRYQKES